MELREGEITLTDDNYVPNRPNPNHRKLMSFNRIPVTHEACDLTDAIAEEIMATEDREYQRRAHKLAAFKDCVGRFLGDLAITKYQTVTDPDAGFGWEYC